MFDLKIEYIVDGSAVIPKREKGQKCKRKWTNCSYFVPVFIINYQKLKN